MRSRAYCGNHRPATGTEKQQCLDDGYPARHPHPAIFSTLEMVTCTSTQEYGRRGGQQTVCRRRRSSARVSGPRPGCFRLGVARCASGQPSALQMTKGAIRMTVTPCDVTVPLPAGPY